MNEPLLTPIYIEKINANDDSYLLADVLFKNSDYVRLDEKIARIETSKAIFEMFSPADGYIYFNPSLQSNHVPPLFLIAVIHKSNQLSNLEIADVFIKMSPEFKPLNQIQENKNSKFSKKALDLITKHNLNMAIFKDKTIVKEIDVLNYIKPGK